MPRAQRKALIEQIEKLRGRRLIVYVTGDRHPAPAQIGDDAVRPLYELLREVGHVEKLDFFIYSRGGAIDVPWRMVTGLRTAAKEWGALIPFRANSAATLIAIGADEIVLGRNGELGPIDPQLSVHRMVGLPGQAGPGPLIQEQISVEDIMAYVRFVKDRAGLSDQSALAAALGKLTERLDAAALGSIYRTHSHIRDVARRLLTSRARQDTQQIISTIIETLAERVYAHGHAIGLRTAKEIGLPAQPANQALDDLMWQLLLEYERDLKLLEPIDPATAVAVRDVHTEPAVLAVIETTAAAFEHSGNIVITARRQMPQNFNVTLNLNLQAPAAPPAGGAPTAQQAALQQAMQQLLQQAQQLILQQAQQAVQQAIQQQAPLVAIEAAFRDGKWTRVP